MVNPRRLERAVTRVSRMIALGARAILTFLGGNSLILGDISDAPGAILFSPGFIPPLFTGMG